MAALGAAARFLEPDPRFTCVKLSFARCGCTSCKGRAAHLPEYRVYCLDKKPMNASRVEPANRPAPSLWKSRTSAIRAWRRCSNSPGASV